MTQHGASGPRAGDHAVDEPAADEGAAQEPGFARLDADDITPVGVRSSEHAEEPAADAAPRLRTLPMAKAINEGLRRAMRESSRVIQMGEDIGTLGGVFRVTDGLKAEFGEERVLDTPLAEAGIVGSAIGLAMRGFRPVCEIQFDGFVFPAFNQITTQLARLQNRYAGSLGGMPVVIRIPYGGHIGAIEHHQESPEAYFAHTPGLRVVSPSTPNDAYWMIQQAIASADPIVFMEPKSRYWHKGEVDTARAPGPLHASRIAREGSDVTVVGHGAMTTMLLQAAALAEQEGVSLEVVDLRSISPIDFGPLLESVRKTGRVVIAQEASGSFSVGSELAAHLAERAFFSLEAPPMRVSGLDVPFPPAKLESTFLPDVDRILESVDRVLEY